MTAAAAAVAQALTEARSVAIFCHIRPDADTIGSGLALARILAARGTHVTVSHPGPSLPAGIDRLLDAAPFAETGKNPEVAVAVDCASLERLGDNAAAFLGAPTRVVIDHHASNTGFGTVNLIDPNANCTTELVLAVADALGAELDERTADCLYAGLLTDTGSFRWASSSGHAVAERLLRAGAAGRELAQDLLDTRPRAWFDMAAAVLASVRADPDAFDGKGAVYAVCSASDRGELGWDAAESLVDLIRTADDCDVAALFKEGEPGQWTVSLRARKQTDVAQFASNFDGGGHRLAAGYSAVGTAEEVVDAFLRRV